MFDGVGVATQEGDVPLSPRAPVNNMYSVNVETQFTLTDVASPLVFDLTAVLVLPSARSAYNVKSAFLMT